MKTTGALLLTAALLFCLASCAGPVAELTNPCKQTAPLDLGWSAHKYVFVGEYHGSNEAPDLFLRAVCTDLSKEPIGKVGVALELPVSFNDLYFRRLQGERPAQIVEQLSEDPFWDEFGDGRHSRAMLDLVIQLIDLSSTHSAGIEILAFQQPKIDVAAAGDIIELGKGPDVSRVFVLTGNAHARLTPMQGFTGNHLAGNVAAQGEPVWSVNILPASGSAWICAPECGVRAIPANGPVPAAPDLMAATGVGDGAYSATLRIPLLTVSEAAE